MTGMAMTGVQQTQEGENGRGEQVLQHQPPVPVPGGRLPRVHLPRPQAVPENQLPGMQLPRLQQVPVRRK